MCYTALARKLLEKMILANKSRSLTKLSQIGHGEIFALQVIAVHDGDITPGDISKAACTTPARIAAELNSLENKQLITREIDTNNRRRILVRITPDGEKAAAKNHCAFIDAAEMLLKQLGEKDAREYVRIIGKIAAIQNDAEPLDKRGGSENNNRESEDNE